MSNRFKREEKKRGKPFPTYTMSEEEWFKLINRYEDMSQDERLKETLVPKIKRIDECSEKAKADQ